MGNADVSSESDDDMDMAPSIKGKHDLMKDLKPSSYFKASKKQYPMFPHFEEKVKYDDYGEIIRYVCKGLAHRQERNSREL